MALIRERRSDSGGFSGQPFQWQEDLDNNSRVNVGRVERWLSLVAGAALAAYAIRRRTLASGAGAIAGAGLMYRGATGHCDLYERLGINRGYGHAMEPGTGFIADRGRTPAQAGGHAVLTSTNRSRSTVRSPKCSLLARLRKLPKFSAISNRCDARRRDLALGRQGTRERWSR